MTAVYARNGVTIAVTCAFVGDHVKALIAGRDDLSAIPPSAPTYVTRAARNVHGYQGGSLPSGGSLDGRSVE